jgi:predicted transcriptional regulator
MADTTTDLNAVELATELTIAWLGNPNTRSSAEDVPAFLGRMHETVSKLLGVAEEHPASEPQGEYTPAVSVRKSLASKDHIISMIDGKPYKTLRRHLATHGLSPAEYRERYGLKPDYPMVAANYSESRRAMAKQIGLGRKPGQKKGEAPAENKPASGGRGRKKAAAAEPAQG